MHGNKERSNTSDNPSKLQPLLDEFKKISIEYLHDGLSSFSSPTKLLPSQETSLSLLSKIDEKIQNMKVEKSISFSAQETSLLLPSKMDEEVQIMEKKNQCLHSLKRLYSRSLRFLPLIYQSFSHKCHNR